MNARMEGGSTTHDERHIFVSAPPKLDATNRQDRLSPEWPWVDHPRRPGVSIPARPDREGMTFGSKGHPAAWVQDFSRSARLAALEGCFDQLGDV